MVKNIVSQALIVVIFAIFFSSCNTDPIEEIVFASKSDVYFIKKRVNQIIRFAPVYNVFGNSSIQSATVTTPEGEIIELESMPDVMFTFSKIPVNDDFTDTIPSDGDYSFSILNKEGKMYQDVDYMEFENMDIPNIRSAGFSEESFAMEVTWDSVIEADAYIVKMLDNDGNLMFSGHLLNSKAIEYSFSEYFEGWYIIPHVGFSYTIQVRAISFDADATELDYSYNIREISISEKNAVWGN